MNAIRRDEVLDNLHSCYVDQWDWERVIRKEDRNRETLEDTVRRIYMIVKHMQHEVWYKYPAAVYRLPKDITFITAQELLDKYPDLSPKERENAIAKEYGAVFIEQIGDLLSNGEPHDGRAPDYDDWEPGGAAGESPLHRPEEAALPQGPSHRKASLHHRRRNRPEPSLHAAPRPLPRRRSPGQHLAEGNARRMRKARRASAVKKRH